MQSRFHQLQLQQHAPHPGQKSRGNSGRRVQRLAQARPLRPQGREGHLDPGPDGLQVRRRSDAPTADDTDQGHPWLQGGPSLRLSHRPTAHELPEVCSRLDGEDEAELFERLRRVATSIGFTVEDADELPVVPTGTALTTCIGFGSSPATPRYSG